MLNSFFLGAAAGFKNRQRTKKSKEVINRAKSIQKKEEEEVYVQFLVDCYNDVYSKMIGSRLKFITHITKKHKSYKIFAVFYKQLLNEKINPHTFFTFAFEQRRAKQIPATVVNICTRNAIEHFLRYQKNNIYRVSTYKNTQNYRAHIENQLGIDIRSLGTLLLRKELNNFTEEESKYLSFYFQAIFFGKDFKTDDELCGKFIENLEFDYGFKAEVYTIWNKLVEDEKIRIGKLVNIHTKETLKNRIQFILTFLENIKK